MAVHHRVIKTTNNIHKFNNKGKTLKRASLVSSFMMAMIVFIISSLLETRPSSSSTMRIIFLKWKKEGSQHLQQLIQTPTDFF